jgi:hypothetical protein
MSFTFSSSVSLSSAESDNEDTYARNSGAILDRQDEYPDTGEFLMQYGDITDGFFRMRNFENGAGVSFPIQTTRLPSKTVSSVLLSGVFPSYL